MIALAAVVSCGALIDGVKEFHGPWALIPVGAIVLFILSAPTGWLIRILAADCRPRTGCWLPRRSRPWGDGALAVSLASAAADLWLAYTGHTRANFIEGTGVLLVSGVLASLTMKYVDNRLRYRAPGHPHPGCDALAVGTVAAVDDGAGLGVWRCLGCPDGDVVHLA